MRIKNNIFPQIIWNLMKYFLYVQRQKVTFGYPGRIPREGKALSILPILKELLRQLFLFYVFCYEQFMECFALHIFSQNRNALMSLKYQDFNSFRILFEIKLNVTS